MTGAPELHGVFANFTNFPGDHIAVFVVRQWQRKENYRVPREIAESAMFAADEPPAFTDTGTRKRLAEIFDRAPLSPSW
jgi:hypothetical protein